MVPRSLEGLAGRIPTTCLVAFVAMLAACASTPPETPPLPAEPTAELASYGALDSVPQAPPPEAPPADETLLSKILRSHPDLAELEDLWVQGGSRYADGEFDLAEEYFYVLRERLDTLHEDQPDSMALIYLRSLDRKLDNFVEILAEERFFAESYAPYEQELDDVYDSLRTAYQIPEFLIPKVERSTFERELLYVNHPKVDKWIAYFTGRGRGTYETWLERRARVGRIIEEILIEEELPTELLSLAMIESGLSARARSRAAAVGWWQFMRGTARIRGLNVNEWIDERRDIELATRAAARHLKLMYGMFGNWPLALAAYNAGEYRIQRAIGLQGDPDYWELRLPRETREYVPKFIAAARIAADPEKFGFELVPEDRLLYDTVELDDTFSLDQIARSGGFSVDELQGLNPQLIAGVTPPDLGVYRVRVPAGRGEATLAAVQEIPEDQRINWRKHRLRSGETLGALARRYRTTSRAIMELNGITNPRRVRAGRVLTIPYPRGVRVAQADPAPAPPQAAEPPSGKKVMSYRVRSGDTLSTIAENHGLSMRSVRALNGIRGTRIRVGQTLVLHVDDDFQPVNPFAVAEDTHERTEHEVTAGETLTAIGRRYGVDVAALLEWNDLEARSVLRPGMRLSIWRPRTP